MSWFMGVKWIVFQTNTHFFPLKTRVHFVWLFIWIFPYTDFALQTHFIIVYRLEIIHRCTSPLPKQTVTYSSFLLESWSLGTHFNHLDLLPNYNWPGRNEGVLKRHMSLSIWLTKQWTLKKWKFPPRISCCKKEKALARRGTSLPERDFPQS